MQGGKIDPDKVGKRFEIITEYPVSKFINKYGTHAAYRTV